MFSIFWIVNFVPLSSELELHPKMTDMANRVDINKTLMKAGLELVIRHQFGCQESAPFDRLGFICTLTEHDDIAEDGVTSEFRADSTSSTTADSAATSHSSILNTFFVG